MARSVPGLIFLPENQPATTRKAWRSTAARSRSDIHHLSRTRDDLCPPNPPRAPMISSWLVSGTPVPPISPMRHTDPLVSLANAAAAAVISPLPRLKLPTHSPSRPPLPQLAIRLAPCRALVSAPVTHSFPQLRRVYGPLDRR